MDSLDLQAAGSELEALRAASPNGEVRLEDALRVGTRLIKRYQARSPRLDAEVIIADLWHKDAIFLFAHPEARLPAELWPRLSEAIIKRCQGCPVAYIVGHKEFYGRDFAVSEATLIPRPETEFLVEAALQECARLGAAGEPLSLLDLCTGSGNVAITLALELPNCRVWAQDISLQALQIAQSNAERLGVRDRLSFLGGSLFAEVPSQQRFSVITANPPYIATEGEQGAEPEVVRFEPHLALFAGRDGLDIIRPLVAEAVKHLLPGGSLLVEIGRGQEAQVNQIMAEVGLVGVRITQDLQNIPRIVGAKYYGAPEACSGV